MARREALSLQQLQHRIAVINDNGNHILSFANGIQNLAPRLKIEIVSATSWNALKADLSTDTSRTNIGVLITNLGTDHIVHKDRTTMFREIATHPLFRNTIIIVRNGIDPKLLGQIAPEHSAGRRKVIAEVDCNFTAMQKLDGILKKMKSRIPG